MAVKYPNFSVDEFKCKCSYVDCTKYGIDSKVMDRMQQLRDIFGKPIRINSGYRCIPHNKDVGGTRSSYHVKGTACDISIEQYNSQDKYDLLEAAFSLFDSVGIYKSFLHLDLRPYEERRYWIDL